MRQDADAELARRLHALAIRLLRRARRDDTAMGLPPGQASALSVLVFGGAKTLSELARIEQVRAPTMTRMIAALEDRGLVGREADAMDRRKTYVAATAAGRRVLQQGRARREAILRADLGKLARHERALVASALDVLEGLAPRDSRT